MCGFSVAACQGEVVVKYSGINTITGAYDCVNIELRVAMLPDSHFNCMNIFIVCNLLKSSCCSYTE